MTDVKLSQLPSASSVAAADLVTVVQGGITKQATFGVLTNSEGIYSGTGLPSIAAPNGSLYLRTDGAAASTLYVRAAGAWSPMTQTGAVVPVVDIGAWEG